ncbi:MAG TPA: glycosyl hydrolase [Opitutaceae bacterium]|nr:glycosyl hydrolase [Opitutaceae bacterium]
MRTLRLLCLAALAAAPGLLRAGDLAWPPITQEQKPWTRWWWPGSAVDRANLTAQLTAIAQDGFGGVEITPIYGARGYESKFIKFLSPQYVDMLRYTAAESHRLGLGVDMATGTGWPFGGPWVSPADAEQKLVIQDGRIVPQPTRFKVKRSAPGGEGWVVNPFSVAALEHYLQPFTQALSGLPAGSIHAQFHDSYEYTASWAPEVPAKFREMHGYDLADHVAELGGQGSPDAVARVKADYRETLGELHLEYVRAWVDWSHRTGSLAREQAHGAPGNLLDIYAAADVPETEIFGSSNFPIPLYRNLPSETGENVPPPLVNRMASSAAHVAGRPLASSETFTWVREHWHEAPSEMKPELDQLLLTGINRIYYHGNAYSPADAAWPGWVFYAATQENTRNSLWKQFGWLNGYIARCQSLLQSGKPDNDILVYWPVYDLWYDGDELAKRFTIRDAGLVEKFTVHDAAAWMDAMPCGRLAADLVAHGYQFDYVSDAQLQQLRVAAGAARPIRAPGGDYGLILVPYTRHMPVATLARLIELGRQGATVVFVDGFPRDVPGYADLAAHREQLVSLVDGLRATDLGSGRQATVGLRGLIAATPSPFSATAAGLFKPIGAVREPLADAGLGVLRRRLPDGELYFVSNLTGRAFDGWAPLSRAARGAVLLDARSGRTGVAALRAGGPVSLAGGPQNGRGGPEVYLQLQPGESVFIKALDHPAEGPAWPYAEAAGAPVPLAGEWRVSFGPDVSGQTPTPPSFSTAALGSWTNEPGEAQRFAGTARYETTFTVPEGAAPDDWRLDLGDVRETARVLVNGQEADRLWSLPFQARIGRFLKPGKNTLVLEVTNLSANHIRDLEIRHVPWKNFHEINFVNIHYQRFDGASWPLQPSGLLGPVTLVPLKLARP